MFYVLDMDALAIQDFYDSFYLNWIEGVLQLDKCESERSPVFSQNFNEFRYRVNVVYSPKSLFETVLVPMAPFHCSDSLL